ncbi:fasciculation and elongation protein zeta-1 isoform X5 [Pezoporus occidentalis]|uniref:fasciculation and elongation protein zeta-1 isoform X5 n=1 Tax=Pezoporus occidentalis TaxID=407982 RepID=UPI002F90A7D8
MLPPRGWPLCGAISRHRRRRSASRTRRSGMLSPMVSPPGAPPGPGCSPGLRPLMAPTTRARAMSVSMLGPCLCRARPAAPPGPPSLCLLQLCEKEEEEEELTERSEQDSGINEEPLLTAEQVIEELEELMQSSPDPEADPEGEEEEEDEEEEEETESDAKGKGSGGSTEPIVLRELHAFSPAFNNNCSHEVAPPSVSPIALGTPLTSLLAVLGRLSARELVAAAGRAEAASRALSAELVAQLARRDELAFEKEVKTAFIGALLAVQGEQREQREAARRRRRDRGLSLQGGRPERGNNMPRKRFSMEGISSILHSSLRQTFGPTANEKQVPFPPSKLPVSAPLPYTPPFPASPHKKSSQSRSLHLGRFCSMKSIQYSPKFLPIKHSHRTIAAQCA